MDASDAVMAKIFLLNVRKAKNGSEWAEKENGKYFVVVDDTVCVAHPRSLSSKIIITWLLLPIFVRLIAHTHKHEHPKLNEPTLTSNDAKKNAYLAVPIFPNLFFYFHFGDG